MKGHAQGESSNNVLLHVMWGVKLSASDAGVIAGARRVELSLSGHLGVTSTISQLSYELLASTVLAR